MNQLLFLLSITSSISLIIILNFFRNQRRHRSNISHHNTKKVVGFFHPYCNAGGGGERVLWTAIDYMQRTQSNLVFVVYTGDQVSKHAMIEKVKNRFGISLSPETLHFSTLSLRILVEDSTYPRLTLVGQSIGSIGLAMEALWFGKQAIVPDVWIDTMGYAFAYPLVRYFCRIPVASYTHYPTISTDMLERVRSRTSSHTNTSLVASSLFLSTLKLVYYRIFARVYTWCLDQADVVMVNSTWTKRHVERLLLGTKILEERKEGKNEVTSTTATTLTTAKLRKRSAAPTNERRGSAEETSPNSNESKIRLLYPPCDTSSLDQFALSSPPRNPYQILSLAQFRPEKEHSLQLLALSKLFSLDESLRKTVRLILSGSVRNDEDSNRVVELKRLAEELGIEKECQWRVNVEYEELLELLKTSGIGLHTMIDEHFGITLVEFQAAGLIPLAHASAGPLLDIIVPYTSTSLDLPSGPTGYLSPDPNSSSSTTTTSKEELVESFASQMKKILSMSEEEQVRVRERARRSAVDRFGVRGFERGWEDAWKRLNVC